MVEAPGPEVDGVQLCCTESSEGDGGAVKPRRSQSTGAVERRYRSARVYVGPEVDGVQLCCTESSEGDGGAVKPRRSPSLEPYGVHEVDAVQ
jgi:hypothetical protein